MHATGRIPPLMTYRHVPECAHHVMDCTRHFMQHKQTHGSYCPGPGTARVASPCAFRAATPKLKPGTHCTFCSVNACGQVNTQPPSAHDICTSNEQPDVRGSAGLPVPSVLLPFPARLQQGLVVVVLPVPQSRRPCLLTELDLPLAVSTALVLRLPNCGGVDTCLHAFHPSCEQTRTLHSCSTV